MVYSILKNANFDENSAQTLLYVLYRCIV